MSYQANTGEASAPRSDAETTPEVLEGLIDGSKAAPSQRKNWRDQRLSPPWLAAAARHQGEATREKNQRSDAETTPEVLEGLIDGSRAAPNQRKNWRDQRLSPRSPAQTPGLEAKPHQNKTHFRLRCLALPPSIEATPPADENYLHPVN
jgi:hypothetical protein